METREVYISGLIANRIRAAHYEPEEKEGAINTIAEYLFDGNTEEAAGLVEFCKNEKMQALLGEIVYWDSPAGDVYHIWKYYNYCLPLLKEYAEKTGHVLRWKAYNEKYNLPIPEYDREPPEIIGGEKEKTLRVELDEGGTCVLNVSPDAIPDGLQPGSEIEIDIGGAKFGGKVESMEEIGGHLCGIAHNETTSEIPIEQSNEAR